MAKCEHQLVSGRAPGSEKCTKCSYAFPCRENTCGHLDCHEHRGKAPHCHYCNKVVVGTRGELWTIWSVRGITRTVDYECRNKHADLLELSRWGELTPKEGKEL